MVIHTSQQEKSASIKFNSDPITNRSSKLPVKVIRACDACGSTKITTNRIREEVCRTCAVVSPEPVLDSSPEYSYYDITNPYKKIINGPPARINDIDIRTEVGSVGDFIHLENDQGRKYWRLRNRNRKFVMSGSRNFIKGLKEIERMCSNLGLPRVIQETSILIYRKGLKKKIFRGKIIISSSASCVYAAIRLRRVPRSATEIIDASNVSAKKLTKDYRLLIKEMGIKVPIPDPFDYVPRIVNSTNCEKKGVIIRECLRMITGLKKAKLTQGKDPLGIASAAVYLACIIQDEKITQKEISTISGITPITIRARFKEIIAALNIQIN